jgi:hypothetical protein
MSAGAFFAGNPANLSFLDLACGMPLGCNGDRPRAPLAASLEEVCARVWSPSFGRGPCYVPFSGGAESSMWLATATRYARRNGHDDPVPLTLRYPGLASTEELSVQERVVAHLRLADWEQIEPEGSLDLVGPVAAATLARTGPLWPPNAYLMSPLVEAARGGVFVFVTGIDDFFSWWPWGRLVRVLERHRRPGKADLAMLATALMPTALRVRAARGRRVRPLPWLRAAAEHEALALLRRRQAEVPLRFDRATMMQVTHRCFGAAAGSLGAIGDEFGTYIDQPLRRPGVVESFAGWGGRRGFRGSTAMLRQMCGDVLPADLLAPRPGPDLTRVFFDDESREFAINWSGAGLDESVVDAEALRRSWLSDRPDPRTACLLQYAWLTENAPVARSMPTGGELLLTRSYQREAP